MVYTFVDKAGEVHALELTKTRNPESALIAPAIYGEDKSGETVVSRSSLRKVELNEGIKVHIVAFHAGRLVLDFDNESPIMISFRGRIEGSVMDHRANERAEKYVAEEFGIDVEETFLARKCIVWKNSDGNITDIIYVLKTHNGEFNTQDGFYRLVDTDDINRIQLPFSSQVKMNSLMEIL